MGHVLHALLKFPAFPGPRSLQTGCGISAVAASSSAPARIGVAGMSRQCFNENGQHKTDPFGIIKKNRKAAA
jgi:hypothetical protein